MVRRPIHRIDGDMVKPEFDELAEEVIVSIYNNDEVVVRLLATPEDLEDLAVGHIACEGKGDIEDISVNNHEITINGSIKMRPRDDILTAACGVCTSGEIEIPLSIVDNTQRLSARIQDMMNLMREDQPKFAATGGIHAASIFDQEGKLLLTREDIGRHNAFDKAIGAAIRSGIVPKIIGLSGRIGWELVAKAIRSNVEIIIGVGAISSAAETLSRNSGITLVGFASREKPVVIGTLSRIIDKP